MKTSACKSLCPAALLLAFLSNGALAQLAGDYQGWLFETGDFEDTAVVEEYCFAQVNVSVAMDDTFGLSGTDEVCWGRFALPNVRLFLNYDPGTESFLITNDFLLQSTRPLVDAGIRGVVDGGERLQARHVEKQVDRPCLVPRTVIGGTAHDEVAQAVAEASGARPGSMFHPGP